MKETELREGVEPAQIFSDAQPFVKMYQAEDQEDTGNEILTIRFNPKNREWLDKIKWYFHEPKDATAIKYALEWASNDIHGKLSEDSWRKICSETRRKPVMKRPQSLDK
jgi:hypothetical protein